MTDMKKILGTKETESYNLAVKYRNNKETAAQRRKTDMQSYHEGKSIAYMDARRIVDAELKKLCNKFQNGNLTISDFDVVL